jgi:hypothetical protein
MNVKKQMRVGERKISFCWDEQARTWHVHGEPARHPAADLEHARTMVRALAEAGALYRPGQPS